MRSEGDGRTGVHAKGFVKVPIPLIEMENDVALFEEKRGIAADADSGRRARGDDVAGHERQPSGDYGNQARYVENQIARVSVLTEFAIDPAFHGQVFGIDLVGGRYPWSHRAKGVEGFAEKPLLVLALAVARGHVVDDGVAFSDPPPKIMRSRVGRK
jgi:hypothetical protein